MTEHHGWREVAIELTSDMCRVAVLASEAAGVLAQHEQGYATPADTIEQIRVIVAAITEVTR